MNRLIGEDGSGHETGSVVNPRWEKIVELAPDLVEKARYISATGDSYRFFNVGGYAVSIQDNGQVFEFWGANTTRKKGDPPFCAEMKIMEDAVQATHDNPYLPPFKIHAMVVSGPPQPDDRSKLESPTLHCCASCRGNLVRSMDENGPVDEQAVIILAHPTMSVYEIYTPPEIVDLHLAAKSKIRPERALMSLRVRGSLAEALQAFETAHPEIAYRQGPEAAVHPA